MGLAPASEGARDRAGWLRWNAEPTLGFLRLVLASIAIFSLGSPPSEAASGVQSADEFEQICLETRAEISRAAVAAQSLGFIESENPDIFADSAIQIVRAIFELSRIGRVEARLFSGREPTRLTDTVAVASIEGWQNSQHIRTAVCIHVQVNPQREATVAKITEAIADALKRHISGEISVSEELSPDNGEVTWKWEPTANPSEEGFTSYSYSEYEGLLISVLSLGFGREVQ